MSSATIQRGGKITKSMLAVPGTSLGDVSTVKIDGSGWSKLTLARFNTIGSVSFDHPDPSIFTVLTSPSDVPGTANVDFVIFPPRWMVAEDTFRPPWFHRNVMSECMGLISGAYDAKADGFVPGALSLHNQMSGHGPDVASWKGASEAVLAPHKIDGTMAFMIESRWVFTPTELALRTSALDADYDQVWSAFPRRPCRPPEIMDKKGQSRRTGL